MLKGYSAFFCSQNIYSVQQKKFQGGMKKYFFLDILGVRGRRLACQSVADEEAIKSVLVHKRRSVLAATIALGWCNFVLSVANRRVADL
jgi:hypothetical protein